MSLSGCKTVVSSHVCPPLQSYSKEFLGDLAKEYAEIIKTYPHVAQVVKDYSITRDDIKSCLQHQ